MTNLPEEEPQHEYVKLDGKESLSTYGGEASGDDFDFAEYGIDFQKCSVGGITPPQMIQLACAMVDHLMLCGHKFEIYATHGQDQTHRLVCLDPQPIDEYEI